MRDIRQPFNGYGNGHCEYMVVNIDKDALTERLERYDKSGKECIGGLHFVQGNGITVAYFDTCEKYSPLFGQLLDKDFPDATIYGIGAWQTIIADTYSKGSDVFSSQLEECFEDGGNLRIDVKLTDKASGCSITVGDLIDFDTADDVDRRDEHPVYSTLMSYLNAYEDFEKVNAELHRCREYHEGREAVS
jgi:hypothetical protein